MLGISFMLKEGQDRDCNSSRETVLSYIQASDEARGEFSSKDVIGSFNHIYWCWTNKCANIWGALKFNNKENRRRLSNSYRKLLCDPVFCERLNEEIEEFLSRWENKDSDALIMPEDVGLKFTKILYTSSPANRKDLLN